MKQASSIAILFLKPNSARTLVAVFIIGLAFCLWIFLPRHWPRANDFTNTIGLDMVWCAPGTFEMGSPPSEDGRGEDEMRHEVRLSHGFWIGRYEVSEGEWIRVMGEGFNASKTRRLFPVECVSWEDANEFCRRLTEIERKSGHLLTGWEYRLPTEAQWEYACRAGTSTPYSTGESLTVWQANTDSTGATPRGFYWPNPWGIYDMHGNLWEWCQDWYGEYHAEPAIDPAGPAHGVNRVARGGSWLMYARFSRSAERAPGEPRFLGRGIFNTRKGEGMSLGFRPVLTKVDEAQ